MRLNGKTILVTGAGQGIGRAASELFAREGAIVHATDRNLSLASQVSGCSAHRLDVTDAEAILVLARDLGPIEILFNCAGYVHTGTLLECTEHDWSVSIDVNVTAIMRTTRAFLPGMLSAGRGNIINMASVAGSIKGVTNRFAYCATKAAVIGLTKSIAADFVGQNIRCNAICPGTVETPSLGDRMAATGDADAARAAFIGRQPMGRLGRPEEIAELALYLASDASSFTTGTTQVIDGGWTN